MEHFSREELNQIRFAEAKLKGLARAADESIPKIPKWLHWFVAEGYFKACYEHDHGKTKESSDRSRNEDHANIGKKGEQNFFCVDCIRGPHCDTERQLLHAGHRVLQVRRASKEDAIKTEDIEKLVDIEGIQEYSINGAKILFLPSRPQAKATKTGAAKCKCCNRSLQSDVLFCSLNCKKEYILHNMHAPLTLRLPKLIDPEEDDRMPGLTETGADSSSPARSPRKKARTLSKAVSSGKGALSTMGIERRESWANAADLSRTQDMHAVEMSDTAGGSPNSVLQLDTDALDMSQEDLHIGGSGTNAGAVAWNAGHSSSRSGMRPVEATSYRKRSRKGVPCRAAGYGIEEGYKPVTYYYAQHIQV